VPVSCSLQDGAGAASAEETQLISNLTTCNHFTAFDEIWHGDASGISAARRPLKLMEFENQRWWLVANLKNQKTVIFPHSLDPFH